MLKKLSGVFVFGLIVTVIGAFWTLHIFSDDRQGGSLFGYQPMIVLSNSMIPEFEANDLIIIKESDTVTEGDVITFQAEENLVTHRVIGVHAEGLETQGDNNPYPDFQLISQADVLGIHALTIPKFGYIVDFLVSPTGLMLLVIGPLLLVAIIEIFRRLFPKVDKEIAS